MSLKNLYPNKPCPQGYDMKLLCASPAIRKCGTYTVNVKDSGISNSVIQDSQPHFTDTNDIPYSDLE